jgi:hypothetical protein
LAARRCRTTLASGVFTLIAAALAGSILCQLGLAPQQAQNLAAGGTDGNNR